MNRALFITIGIVLIIIIFFIWLFLFLNGAPTNTREVFSDLGIIEPIERPLEAVGDMTVGDENVILNLTDGQLQQVTIAPVAGYAVASTSESISTLRYIERGTGYIFEVNLSSGLQSQVTPTTIPNAVEAYFSPNLSHVVVVTEQADRQVTLLELPDDDSTEAVRTSLASDAENIQFIDNDTLVYTHNTYTDTTAYTYDLAEKTVAERFTIDIPDATVLITENNNTYAYPKPTALFEGSLYAVEGGELTPASWHLLSLVAFVDNGIGIVNFMNDSEVYRAYRLPGYTPQPIAMVPEKCVGGAITDHVWCAASESALDDTFIEAWYKGLVNSDDVIWDVNTMTGEGRVLFAPKATIGRQIDAVQMSTNQTKDRLLFINKIDSTLWLLNL